MSNNSKQSNYDSKADLKDVIIKSGPPGLIVVYYIAVSILGIIVLGLWWMLN